MKTATHAAIAALVVGAWTGCADEAPAPSETAAAPAAAPTPTPPTPMLPPRPAPPETPSPQQLPLPDDFEEEAASEITAETYLAALDELEEEISAAEERTE